MAQRVQTVLVSDISGEEIIDGGETIAFSYRGAEYSIDLTDEEAAVFDAAIATYLEHAQRVGGRKARTTRTSSAPTAASASTDKEQLQAIREWGRENGWEVSDRGRVSKALRDAYAQAS